MKMMPFALLALLPLAAACGETSDASQAGAEAGDEAAGDAAADEGLTLDTRADGDQTLMAATGGDDAPFDSDCVIANDGVAGIGIPATLGDFAAAFPAPVALRFEPNFMVDFGALCTLQGGEDAVCAIFESYDTQSYRADKEVAALAVYAPQCRTAEGVGPGTAIEEAETAYGNAIFAFNYANEGREYVAFERGPANLSFRAESDGDVPQEPGWPSGRSAGDYSGVTSDGGEYFETGEYRPGAHIWEVWLSGPVE